MRLLLIASALFLSACGRAGGASAPADTFVLGEPQYKQPNVKQTTRAYKDAFKAAETYFNTPADERADIGVKDVVMDRRSAVENAEEAMLAPFAAREEARKQEARKAYFKGIRSVSIDRCVWSRVPSAVKQNYLYKIQGLSADRGWQCGAKVVVKECPRCERIEAEGVMLFVQTGDTWVFAAGRELSGNEIGCAMKHFLGTDAMNNDELSCVVPAGETWPPAAS